MKNLTKKIPEKFLNRAYMDCAKKYGKQIDLSRMPNGSKDLILK